MHEHGWARVKLRRSGVRGALETRARSGARASERARQDVLESRERHDVGARCDGIFASKTGAEPTGEVIQPGHRPVEGWLAERRFELRGNWIIH